jgi:FixJ family two-component response regulator
MQNHRQLIPKNPTVVVVDDDPAVCNSLKFSLEIEGYTVRTYPDGAALLNEADLNDCACLVIDQNLPGLVGIDVVTRLRERHIAAPVILITSHPNAALGRNASRAGIHIVEKPLLDNALIDRIRRTLDPQPKH